MKRSLERQVWKRANSRCEYCQMSQEHDAVSFEIDHVIAVSHAGPSRAKNLALACFLDNSYKGPNLAGIDPRTKRITPLFNPRRQQWRRHFRWDGPVLVGRTAAGRATIAVLRINLPHRIAQREALIEEGVFPPG
ncbi:MAG TPA: HNH endonuclease signature motif containing protein [Gemmataceae bacterium]|nr:HNH endonuclease signature motif containing protein [Gemmataceae bacterium]